MAELVKARADFNATHSLQISLKDGELIEVLQKITDVWWYGRKAINKEIGFFPADYVTPISPPPKEEAIYEQLNYSNLISNLQAKLPPQIPLNVPKHRPTIKPIETPSVPPRFDYVIATESYESERGDELDIEKGDRIRVTAKNEPEWWTGVNERTGNTGIFRRKIVQNENENNDLFIVISPYKSDRSTDIDLELNDIIKVLERPYEKWWKGENQRTHAVGLFLAKLVQPYKPKPKSEQRNFMPFIRNNNKSPSENIKERRTTSALSGLEQLFPPRKPPQQIIEKPIPLIIGWSPANGSEDSIDTGFASFTTDSVQSSDKSDPISEDESSCSEQDDIYAMRILDSSSSNDNQEKNSSQQRFYAIYELFQTEEAYLRELHFTIENFRDPIRASGLIPVEEVEAIFVNLQEIYRVNYAFYIDLSNQCQVVDDSAEQKIGALLMDHMRTMLPIYRDFCSSNVAELSAKIEENEQFSEDLVQISSKQNSYQTFRSGLSRPMQRIMRYRLLIERIADLTPIAHYDQIDCAQALEYVKEFCEQINKTYDHACLQWEPFKRMSWIQKHLTMSSKNVDQIIDFNSETLFLGPRVLLHSGILYHRSTILFAFLFNDILVLATTKCKNIDKILNEKKDNFNVFDHKETRHLKCALYEKPFLLRNLKISDTNSFGSEPNSKLFRMVVRLDKGEISLKAWSTEEWIVWMQQVSRAKFLYERMEKVFFNIEQMKPKVIANHHPIAILSLARIEAYQLYTRNYALNAYCKIAMGRDWSTAHSMLISHTERKVMDFRKAKEGILSKLQTGTRRSLAFGSKPSETAELEDSHRTRWDIAKQIKVYEREDMLMIRFYDSSPYAPHQFLGEVKVPFIDFMQQPEYVTNATTERRFSIELPSEMLSKNFMCKLNVNPYIMLNYQFTIYTNPEAIRRLIPLAGSLV